MRHNIHILLLALVVFFSMARPASADPSPLTADDILKKIASANPGLKDYTSDLSIRLNVKYSVLATALSLKGVQYYKAPDKSRIEIKNKPVFLAKYPDVFDFHLKNFKDYTVKVRKNGDQDGNFYILDLTPSRVIGDMERRVLWVSRDTFSIPKEELYYKNNGSIKVETAFKKVQGYLLYDVSRAEVSFPSMSLSGRVEMTNQTYRINTGLSDDVFRKKQ